MQKIRDWLEVIGVSAFVILCLALGGHDDAYAQQVVQAQTVSACGTPNNTPKVGNSYPITQDNTGKLCTSGTGGGGGGGAVTMAAGAVVSGAYLSGSLASGAVVDLTNVETTAGGTAPGKAISVQGIAGGTGLPVTGTFFQTTQPVSGTFFQATQPVSIASAQVASGAVASGAFASGSIASGAIVSGADVTEGTITTAHTCSVSSYTVIGCLGQVDDDVKGPIAAGTAIIGKVGIDQTTPGTTNAVQANVVSGGIASGAVASGAFASGSIASGAIVSGADVTEGSTSPSVTCSGTWTVNGCLAQLHTDATSSIPTGANVIGVTGVAQGSTTSGQSGDLTQMAITTANPANTTGQTSPLSGTITGALRTVNAPGTMETCSSGNVANGTVACTLAQTAAHTTYIAGFAMTSNGATATSAVSCTLTGVITGTMTFTYTYQALASLASAPLIVQFNPPIPASATGTTIVASCPAGGTGAANAAMNAWGFQQ